MKKFKKIAIIDPIFITDEAKNVIQTLSVETITYPKKDTANNKEIIKRIGNADAILGNWQSTISENILRDSQQLKYIGICGTSMANIDTSATKKHNIVVNNVTDYGDEGVAEYIFAQLLNLVRGFGQHKWKENTVELNNKTIGIIGMGATGQQVARIALGFKMKVLYFSKSRKLEWEDKGIKFTKLDDLLQQSDIISLHTPKNLKIIGEKELKLIGNGKIITDTCLGIAYKDFKSVREWIKKDGNYFIRDYQPEIYKNLGDLEKFIYTDGIIAGLTKEAKDRLSTKVVDNIKNYLKKN